MYFGQYFNNILILYYLILTLNSTYNSNMLQKKDNSVKLTIFPLLSNSYCYYLDLIILLK